MIDHIPELIEGGASSLKIEGRMKSVYYVAAVVAAYRKAIDTYYAERGAYRVREEWRERGRPGCSREIISRWARFWST